MLPLSLGIAESSLRSLWSVRDELEDLKSSGFCLKQVSSVQLDLQECTGWMEGIWGSCCAGNSIPTEVARGSSVRAQS